MNRTIKIYVQIYMLGTCGMLFSHSVAVADPLDQRLQKVLVDWQNRQNWFQTVEYKVGGTHKVRQGAYSTKLPIELTGSKPSRVNPPRDVEAPVNFMILLDFAKGRHRRDIRESQFDSSTGNLIPALMKDAFNGSVMKCLIPKGENPGQQVGTSQPELTIVSGNMKNGQFRSNYFPILFAHGRIYTAMEPILPGQLRSNPDSDYLYIHGESVYEGRPCLIIRTQTLKMATTSFDEYWVDNTRESAIVRYLSYSGEKAAQDIGIHYKNSHDHWLLDSWRYTVYRLGSVLSSEEMRVEQITLNPPVQDADFELEVKPGMLVEERTDPPTLSPIVWPNGKLSVYKVKEDGGREAIPDPFHRPGDQYQDHRQRRWFFVALFVLIVGAVSIFWIRHRKSAVR